MSRLINLAVAEKLAHLEREEWTTRRRKVTPELIAKGLAALNRPMGIEPEPEDRLPEGYELAPR